MNGLSPITSSTISSALLGIGHFIFLEVGDMYMLHSVIENLSENEGNTLSLNI